MFVMAHKHGNPLNRVCVHSRGRRVCVFALKAKSANCLTVCAFVSIHCIDSIAGLVRIYLTQI